MFISHVSEIKSIINDDTPKSFSILSTFDTQITIANLEITQNKIFNPFVTRTFCIIFNLLPRVFINRKFSIIES